MAYYDALHASKMWPERASFFLIDSSVKLKPMLGNTIKVLQHSRVAQKKKALGLFC